jgi:uncharacterized delta-60 repeat protein
VRGLGALAITCACALGLVGAAGAALDPSFGSGGEIVFANDERNDLAIDLHGRVVTTGNEFGGAATIRRLLPDGSGDPTFGIGGLVRDPLGGVVAISGGGAVDSEGRILIAGHAEGSRYVARYLPDGTRDASFGNDGVARFGTSGTANELHVDHEDRPIVLDGAPVRLTRLTADGELDSSFGPDGILTTDIAFLGDFDISDRGVITVAGVAFHPEPVLQAAQVAISVGGEHAILITSLIWMAFLAWVIASGARDHQRERDKRREDEIYDMFTEEDP